uniref:hypothetical protein n=1 Tax=Salmonella bongori TaxID=54736 RepID=UPI00195735C3
FKNYDFENNRANVIMVKACCNWKDYESLAEDLFHCMKCSGKMNIKLELCRGKGLKQELI